MLPLGCDVASPLGLEHSQSLQQTASKSSHLCAGGPTAKRRRRRSCRRCRSGRWDDAWEVAGPFASCMHACMASVRWACRAAGCHGALQVYGNTRDGELYGLRNTEKALRADLTNARSEIDHLRRQVSSLNHRSVRLLHVR
jgi:hypothetical protein